MFPDLVRDDVFRLETRRLWLRWPRAADASALVALADDRDVAEMLTEMPHPYRPEHAHAFILEARRANSDGRRLTMAIAPRARPDALLGVVGIACDREPEPFLGYWVGRPHWGEGIATEAARALVDAFFRYADMPALAASARTVNPASRRVLEKVGFAAVGSGTKRFPARDAVLPVDHLALDRAGWAAGAARPAAPVPMAVPISGATAPA